MLKPIKTRVILKKQEQNRTTAAGIFLQGSVDGASVYCDVIAVGSTVETVKVGDVVVPDWRAVIPVKYEDVDYLLVEEKGIIGVIDDEN